MGACELTTAPLTHFARLRCSTKLDLEDAMHIGAISGDGRNAYRWALVVKIS